MNWFSRNPIFNMTLCLMLGVVLVGMWYATMKKSELAELVDEYDRKSQVFDGLLRSRVSPTAANLEALEENHRELYEVYRAALAQLNLNSYDKERFFGDEPADHNEAFFRIAGYVEESRRLALGKGIAFGEDNRFGFSNYVNRGPRQEDIPSIHRQIKVMEVILQALFDSGVTEIVGIQREPVAGEKNAIVSPKEDSFGGDLFEVRDALSYKIDDMFASDGFRLAFKGQSFSLRNFLNRVSNSSLPFVIRSIEVSSSAAESGDSNRVLLPDSPFFDPSTDTGFLEEARVPIIVKNESQFVVTLEFLDEVNGFLAPESGEEARDA